MWNGYFSFFGSEEIYSSFTARAWLDDDDDEDDADVAPSARLVFFRSDGSGVPRIETMRVI